MTIFIRFFSRVSHSISSRCSPSSVLFFMSHSYSFCHSNFSSDFFVPPFLVFLSLCWCNVQSHQADLQLSLEVFRILRSLFFYLTFVFVILLFFFSNCNFFFSIFFFNLESFFTSQVSFSKYIFPSFIFSNRRCCEFLISLITTCF